LKDEGGEKKRGRDFAVPKAALSYIVGRVNGDRASRKSYRGKGGIPPPYEGSIEADADSLGHGKHMTDTSDTSLADERGGNFADVKGDTQSKKSAGALGKKDLLSVNTPRRVTTS